MQTDETVLIVLGDNTPEGVRKEVSEFKDTAVLDFSWDNEDNECMPLTAKYLADKYNVYRCGII